MTLSLRAFYQLGKRAIQSDPDSVNPATRRRARGSFARLCKELGRGRNELTKARKFARLYNAAKLKWICSLGQNKGRPLTKSHICRLVVVRSSRLRDKLATQSAKHGWSVQRLEIEIKKHQPKRRYGGRQVHRPQTLDELLGDMEGLTNRWIRWDGVVTGAGGGSGTRGASSKEIPRGIRKRQLEITLEMHKLQRQIQRRIDRQIERLQSQSRKK